MSLVIRINSRAFSREEFFPLPLPILPCLALESLPTPETQQTGHRGRLLNSRKHQCPPHWKRMNPGKSTWHLSSTWRQCTKQNLKTWQDGGRVGRGQCLLGLWDIGNLLECHQTGREKHGGDGQPCCVSAAVSRLCFVLLTPVSLAVGPWFTHVPLPLALVLLLHFILCLYFGMCLSQEKSQEGWRGGEKSISWGMPHISWLCLLWLIDSEKLVTTDTQIWKVLKHCF